MRTDIIILIIGMAAVTYATRAGSLAILKKAGVPAWLERWLKHLPVAMLTALIVPALLVPRGHLDLSLQNHHLIAGVVAALVCIRGYGVMPTMGAGLACILILKFIVR